MKKNSHSLGFMQQAYWLLMVVSTKTYKTGRWQIWLDSVRWQQWSVDEHEKIPATWNLGLFMNDCRLWAHESIPLPIATLYDRSQYAVSLYQRGISNSNVPSCVHIASSEFNCVELIGISDVMVLKVCSHCSNHPRLCPSSVDVVKHSLFISLFLTQFWDSTAPSWTS